VLEFSKFLSDMHCPISICLDHVKQYSCMRSSPNIIDDDNVNKTKNKKTRRWEIFKNVLFLEKLDLELMNDLENSANNRSSENCSPSELNTCIEGSVHFL